MIIIDHGFPPGFILDFISAPVLDGLLSAVAVTAISGQMPALLGIQDGGDTFVQKFARIVENIGGIKLWDSVLGLICMAVMYLPKVIRDAQRQ